MTRNEVEEIKRHFDEFGGGLRQEFKQNWRTRSAGCGRSSSGLADQVGGLRQEFKQDLADQVGGLRQEFERDWPTRSVGCGRS